MKVHHESASQETTRKQRADVLGVEFPQGALRKEVGQVGRRAVAGPSDQNHLLIVLANDAIAMCVHQVDAWTGPPVAQKARLDVPRNQIPFQQKVVLQIDLGRRQVVDEIPARVQSEKKKHAIEKNTEPLRVKKCFLWHSMWYRCMGESLDSCQSMWV